jgi:hypothetical protein
MVNIFFHPSYHLSKKKFFTLKLRKSILFNVLIRFLYLLNKPINSRLITNGPHKLMNNLVKTFKDDKRFVFKKINYQNSYLVQFDKYGEVILKKLLKKYNKNQKILIGPLYDIRYEEKLNNYLKEYSFIKKVVASQSVYNSQINDLDFDNSQNQLVVLPSGIIKEDKLVTNSETVEKKDCLIYFKNRNKKELEGVLKYLDSLGIKYYLFTYGKYNNADLIDRSKKVQFGIILSGTESQGFAIQELMSTNLPLFVLNKNTNNYENLVLSGTSVSYWDERCGIKIDNYENFKDEFNYFYNNLSKYSPVELVKEKLTYEVYKSNLLENFEKFN